MAFLTFTTSEEKQGSYMFISKPTFGLICDNTSLISTCSSLLANSEDDGMDTCSFYSGPSDNTIFAFGESSETTGAIAYESGTESCGSIAFAGTATETCSSFSSGASLGGACNISC